MISEFISMYLHIWDSWDTLSIYWGKDKDAIDRKNRTGDRR